MILSDRSIREELAAGRIKLEPSDDSLIQPASVDVRLDRYFRVFLNHTMPVIDVRKNLEELTRLVEIDDDRPFVLHPGEFVLGSTFERVALPDDLVARIEGKSSLGRLGLLIHSSLPAGEELLVRDDQGVRRRTIGEIVKEQRRCEIVGFDPETFEVGYHEVTGFYEGPEDRIFEVRLASGRRICVTAGHNLFTLDHDGHVRTARTAELADGVMVAVAGDIPEPPDARARIDLRPLIPEGQRADLLVEGPTVERAMAEDWATVSAWLEEAGLSPGDHRSTGRLPWTIAECVPGVHEGLGEGDFVRGRNEHHPLPLAIVVDADLAWSLGMYVAEGSVRDDGQVVITAHHQHHLDRLEATFARLGLPVHRGPGAIACSSKLLSDVFAWLMGRQAATKRAPSAVFGWPRELVEAFLDGLVDGDGSVAAGGETSVWTTSVGLVSDVLLLFACLGKAAGSTCEATTTPPRWQVRAPQGEHEGVDTSALDRLIAGGLAWDRVVEVIDTGQWEPIYDIEVRPDGKKIGNFLAGRGGVFASNTAGFIDAGFDGHITLELSNVANLPITLYPGMKIGQISFLRMTTPADVPYGQGALGSKYQGQRGPTPSRYWENFETD